MPALSELKEIKFRNLESVLFLALATVCPGISTIIVFRPGYLEMYDAFKLLLVSFALTLPGLLLTVVLFVIFDFVDATDPDGRFFLVPAGSYTAMVYGDLLACYFRGLPFRVFLLFQVGTFVFLTLCLAARKLNLLPAKRRHGD